MGKVSFKGSGGGTVYSFDLEATSANVLFGKKYVGADSDDDIGLGTMPNNSMMEENGTTRAVGVNSNYPGVPTREGTSLQIGTSTDGVSRINICVPLGYQPGNDAAYVNRPATDFGDAKTSEVLEGKTVTSTAGVKVSGRMPNRGAWHTVVNEDATVTIPAGYHDGGGYVKWGTTQTRHGAYTSAASIGYGNGTVYLRIPKGIYVNNSGSGYPEITASLKEIVATAGIPSASSFSASRSGSNNVSISFNAPGSGTWTGLRVVGKLGSYPSSPNDGQCMWDMKSSGTNALNGAGNWYFRAWDYWESGTGRVYGNYHDASVFNGGCSCVGQCSCNGNCSDHCSDGSCRSDGVTCDYTSCGCVLHSGSSGPVGSASC